MPKTMLFATCLAALFAQALPAQAQSLTTLFTSNNGGSTGWVVMFDATVLPQNPAGLRIVALDTNCSTANVAVTVNLWLTPNTYIGVERNASAWIKVATGTTMSAARDTATHVDLSDYVLPVGTWGLAVQTVGSGQAYTNGTGTNQSFADSNLSLSLGAALASEFLSTGLLFTPRVYNGAIYYATRSDAVFGVFGSGCAGSNGVPKLAPASGSVPSLGQLLQLDLTQGPTLPTAGLITFGFSKTVGLGQPLPWDLSFAGFTGCSLLVDPLLQIGVGVVNSTASLPLPIPNNPALLGVQLYSQAFVLDQTANPAGFSMSNGAEGQIGL